MREGTLNFFLHLPFYSEVCNFLFFPIESCDDQIRAFRPPILKRAFLLLISEKHVRVSHPRLCLK